MGSSYRQDLNGGSMKEWEHKLREACRLIDEVRDDISDCIGEDGQFDNAADDGALREKLWIARRFIEEELPTPHPK